jgi:hypothetical protein
MIRRHGKAQQIPYKLAYKPPLCGGLIEKGIYYVDGLCAIQILLGRVGDPPLRGGGRGDL